MKTLREALADADARQAAIGHFNISEFGALKGIMDGARELSAAHGGDKLPILIGVSEGEREFLGVKEAAAMVRAMRDMFDYPVYINADHTHSIDKVREVAEAGFDEIIFDASKLPFEENLAQTKEAVALARSINPAIVIEGEIGYIGSSSEIVSERPQESMKYSTPDEAARFVRETGVDVLAPAVGNMHGLLKSMVTGEDHKKLDIALIGEIRKAIGDAGCRFMTLHGGSGTADEDFVAAAKNGMTIIHVSSELRLAWRQGMERSLKDQPDEIAPYKLLGPSVEHIKNIVSGRLRLFNGI